MKTMMTPADHRAVGVCTTCADLSGCGFRQRVEGPIWNCNEFAPELAATRKVTPSLEGGSGDTTSASRFRGICTNCDHRGSCHHATVVGGVWHCQEYL